MATDSVTLRFAAACGLLGQYAAARTAAAPSPASASVAAFVQQPAGTTAAFVQQQQQGIGSSGGANNADAAQQLTIFYGGMVVVLDGCTPEKAGQLIRLAAAAAGQGAPKPAPALVDTPIARNASLRRFLSKRKDRRATAPVLGSEPAPLPLFERQEPELELEPAAKRGKRLEEAAPWLELGLGSLQGSMHAS